MCIENPKDTHAQLYQLQSMDDDGFFGFDTALPVNFDPIFSFSKMFHSPTNFIQSFVQPVRRGPQQEFGDVELEDTYDALNDETFGVATLGTFLYLNIKQIHVHYTLFRLR